MVFHSHLCLLVDLLRPHADIPHLTTHVHFGHDGEVISISSTPSVYIPLQLLVYKVRASSSHVRQQYQKWLMMFEDHFCSLDLPRNLLHYRCMDNKYKLYLIGTSIRPSLTCAKHHEWCIWEYLLAIKIASKPGM